MVEILPQSETNLPVNNCLKQLQSQNTLSPVPIQSIFQQILPQPSLVSSNNQTQNAQNLASSLMLNLNLPSSISSILFKKSTTENNDQKPSIEKSETNALERPRDPRQQSTNLSKNKIVNHSIDQINTDNAAKNSNPIFDKIQNILTHGVKLVSTCPPRNNLRNKYVTAENDRFVIKRSKPLENFNEDEPEVKSQLVILSEKETRSVDTCSESMILKINKKNTALENMIKIRNTTKIAKLKEFYEENKIPTETYEMFEEFLGENDLLKSLNHLMNYDFCNNKYNPNKTNRKKKKNKQPKLNMDLFEIDHDKRDSTNYVEKVEECDDILYGDIDDFSHNIDELIDMKSENKSPLPKFEQVAHEIANVLDYKGMVAVKKQKTYSHSSCDASSNDHKENKHTSKVLKQEEKSKKNSRSTSPRRKMDDKSSRHRSSRSDSKNRNENLRRSRSNSRPRAKSKEVKNIDPKSRVDYSTKKESERNYCSDKYADSVSSKLNQTNKDKPLKQSQELNKNFKRKRVS
jgi:hypothetical protein